MHINSSVLRTTCLAAMTTKRAQPKHQDDKQDREMLDLLQRMTRRTEASPVLPVNPPAELRWRSAVEVIQSIHTYLDQAPEIDNHWWWGRLTYRIWHALQILSVQTWLILLGYLPLALWNLTKWCGGCPQMGLCISCDYACDCICSATDWFFRKEQAPRKVSATTATMCWMA
jgi:hypothetical protein